MHGQPPECDIGGIATCRPLTGWNRPFLGTQKSTYATSHNGPDAQPGTPLLFPLGIPGT